MPANLTFPTSSKESSPKKVFYTANAMIMKNVLMRIWTQPLCELLFTRKMKKLSKPDSFILFAKFQVEFSSTSEMLYLNKKVIRRKIRAKRNFYKISDNPNLFFGIDACSVYTRCIALKDDYHTKKWTSLHITLWNSTIWRLWHRLLSFPKEKTNSFKKTILPMLYFVDSLLQGIQTLHSLDLH